MKELIKLVEKLNEALKVKEIELLAREDNNAHTQGLVNNRRNDIQIFSDTIKEVSNDPSYKNEIILNFTNAANEIIKEINQI